MKKIIVMALSVFFIVMSAQAQVTFDNPLDEKLEIRANGQTKTVGANQTGVMLDFVKPNKETHFYFRWFEQNVLKSSDMMKTTTGHLKLSRNEIMTGNPSTEVSNAGSNTTANSSYRVSEPGTGTVNFITNVKSEIGNFKFTIENHTDKNLIFIGSIFNGVALKPLDEAESIQSVQPGLIELTVLYKISSSGNDDSLVSSGQATAFNQQALSYMIVDGAQTIQIMDQDLVDPTSMTNQKVKFRNVSNVSLYPKSNNRKLRKGLRPGQTSGTIQLSELTELAWYYNDIRTGMERIVIFQIVFDRTPIIEIRPMQNVYGTARSR